jgi:hypothetical protein
VPLQDARARFTLFTRQGVLLAVAIVVPCLLLVGLSARMLFQERELSEKRAADGRRQLAGQIRQHLLTYLERVTLEALSGRPAPAALDRETSSAHDALALVAALDGDRLVLPWDDRPQAGAPGATAKDLAFADAIRAGEHEEFVARRFDRAADAYGRAVAVAPAPAQQAAARLARARTLRREAAHETPVACSASCSVCR